jgi:histidine kinase
MGSDDALMTQTRQMAQVHDPEAMGVDPLMAQERAAVRAENQAGTATQAGTQPRPATGSRFRTRNCATVTVAEAHRLKKLTRDLSTLSKAQEGAIEYNIETADLVEVTNRVIDALGPQYEVNGVNLEIDLDEPLPVSVDADRIAQALTNLLGNALAHTPPEGSVRVSGVAVDGICTVAITDTGAGIPQSQLETIFERFTRLDREQPGTGIGLNIARTLVRAHGGDIRATSPGPDQGSTFTLELPLRRQT